MFVTAAKQARNLHLVNFDQLYAFLKHNEKDAKEVREMRQQFPNLLALMVNAYNPPPSYSSQRFQYHSSPHEVYQPYQFYQSTTTLHTTANFKADHVDAYDSDYDDEATASTIFMTNVQETEYIEQSFSNNDSYDELTSNNNVISYADYMVTIENDAAQYVPPPAQDRYNIFFYDEAHKTALGYQNPLYLRQAQRKQPVLYNAKTLVEKHDLISVCDSEETLILAEESRLKLKEKQTEINAKPIDYSKLNNLYEYFVPQKQLSAEQLYWSLKPTLPESVSKPTKVFPKNFRQPVRIANDYRNCSKSEYDMWKLRIKQYFQVQDYALWDVIENGNSFKPAAQTTTNADGSLTTLIPGSVTADEKTQKKNDVKVRSMLLMALLNEHLLTFNQYKEAKSLFAAIQIRFGGNDATKKTQKTLLKQMYENFSALSTESLNSSFNRLLKIVSQLDILGINLIKIVKQEVKGTASSSSSLSSQNLAFMSSTSSTNEVNTAYGVSTVNTQVSTASTQVSTANLSNDTVYAFLKTGRKITINESDTAGYDKSKVECFNCHKLGHFSREYRGPRNQDNRSRNQDSSRRTINVEEIFSKAMLAIDGAGFDLSFMADEEVPRDMALMDFSDSEVHDNKTCSKTCLKSFETLKTQDLRIEFNKSEFNLATYKRGLTYVKEQLVFYKKNEVLFYEQLVVLKRDISYKDSEISVLKSELEKPKQEKENNQLKIEIFYNASKSLDKLIGSKIPDKSRKGLGFVSYNAVPPPTTRLFSPPNLDLSNSGLEKFQQPEFEGYGPKTSKSVREDTSNEVRESPNALLVEELVSNDKLEKKTIFPTAAKINFANCNYHQRERMVSSNIYTRVNYNYSAKKAHPSAHKNIVPRAVLMKTGLRPLNIASPVNTAHPKTIVYSARPMSCFSKSAQSTVKRPYSIKTTLTNKNYSQKVNIAKGSFYTARPKAVNTTRPNLAVVNAVRKNQVNDVNASACWVWRHTKLINASITFKRLNYVDARGRSKHMTGNMSYLSDFKEFDGGYIAFRGGAKGGRITSKGTLKTENLVDKIVKIMIGGNGSQFQEYIVMSEFCEQKGIKREFSIVRTPQQNGVAERRNRTLIETARTMLPDSKLPTTFWAKAVSTACYVQNRVLVVKPHNKTPYELFRGRTPALSFMRPFGCHVTILNTLDYLDKFDKKSDEGFFIGYSMNSKAFRVYNIRTRKVEENLHIRFLEDKPIIAGDGPK
ncbi:retrovirus-related pol polyprotein from transposon TNT 1-94 [Tanacetum coccineum]